MAQASRDARPNVLLIVSDQHRLDCVGASQDYPVSTPNIDALARDGAWFGSAFTPIPLCTPARQSLLTGVRAESTGGLWNYDLGSRISPLDPREYAWPRELHEAGYRSQYIGKWHVHPDNGPTTFGYDSWIPLEAYDEWREERYPGDALPNDWFGSVDTVPTPDSRTHWMADRASDFITEAAATGEPWHLRVDFLEPHLPCLPSPEFAARYSADSIPEWRDFADPLTGKPYIQQQQLVNWGVDGWTWEQWAPIVARYYAIVEQLDDALGRMLATLEQSGQASETLVVYTTDHGDLGGSRGMMDKHYVMYDSVVRVPLVMRWPDRIPAGTRSDAFAYNMLDLPPTIAAAAGIAGPPRSHGTALFDDREGTLAPSASADAREHVVATYNGQQFGLFTQRMLRTREWKYVWNPTDIDELYHLSDDPEELTNLVAAPVANEVLPELRARLYHQLRVDGDSFVANDWMARQLLDGRKLAQNAPVRTNQND